MDPRTRALLEAPIVPTLLRLALPNVAVMVVQAGIGLIETYFVAKLGTDALAGIALVFPLLMVIQMISAGAMGGGILSGVARALGSNRRDDANVLVWHAVAIAVALGVLTTAAALLGGPKLYALMGGRDGSLVAALTYSNLIFLGAIPLWLYNSLAAVIRGTGNMIVPASVTIVGAIVLLPLSPALIFGLGPLPRLGIAGGAAAVVAFYVVGSAIFASYLWSGRGVLRPSLRPPALAWAPTREILRIGAVSSLVSITTNVSIATATGLAGTFGPAAVAEPAADLGGVNLRVKLHSQVRAVAIGLHAHLVARQHPRTRRRQAPVAVELQPRTRLDHLRNGGRHRHPADLAPRRRLDLPAERNSQRLRTEADAEHGDARRIRRAQPVQLGGHPVGDPLVVDRPGRAEHDHVVHAVEGRQRPLAREQVRPHLRPACRERVRDKAGIVDAVMSNRDYVHDPILMGTGCIVHAAARPGSAAGEKIRCAVLPPLARMRHGLGTDRQPGRIRPRCRGAPASRSGAADRASVGAGQPPRGWPGAVRG